MQNIAKHNFLSRRQALTWTKPLKRRIPTLPPPLQDKAFFWILTSGAAYVQNKKHHASCYPLSPDHLLQAFHAKVCLRQDFQSPINQLQNMIKDSWTLKRLVLLAALCRASLRILEQACSRQAARQHSTGTARTAWHRSGSEVALKWRLDLQNECHPPACCDLMNCFK